MLQRNKLSLSIGVAVLSGGLFSPLVVAQEALFEEIIVTGIRTSLQDAMSTKRNADNIVDAISSEDVGKFPDKNIAESLSRMTGVAVSREFGEGEKVSIRGAGPDYNRTTLNGQSVATADWFILDNPARSFNFTLLPSTLISSLEVSKSPTASQDEGSLGGTVNVRTHRPLDLAAGEGAIAVESIYSETSEEMDPSISGQYSWKNDSETFGVLLSATRQDRTVQRSGFEVLSWTDEATPGIMVPGTMGAPTFYQERERETYFLSAQFRATDQLLFTLDALDSTMSADNMNGNWLVFSGDNAAEHAANGEISGSSVVASEITGAGRGVVNWINRVSSSETQSLTLTAEYESDVFALDVVLGSTSAEGGTYRETSWEYGWDGGNYAFDLNAPSLSTNPAPSDAEAYTSTAGWIWGGEKPTTDEENYFQVDLELPVDAGAFTAIKTGIKVRNAERTQDRIVYSWHGADTMAGNEDLADTYLDYILASCPTLASCGLNSGGTINIDSPVGGNATEVIEQMREVMEEIAFGGLNGVSADYAISRELANNWEVEEDIFAVYLQADFESESFRGNFGVRYVTTDQASSGWRFSDDSWGFDTLDREWLAPSELEWVTVDNKYSEFLPSVNLAYDLNEDMVLRASAARVMARQNWNQISPFETYGALNAPDPKGQAGNPELKPFIANQLDFGYEWYYGDVSAFSATLFFKDNQSYLVQETYTDARYYEADDVWVDVDFSRPANGIGGAVSGLELAILHDFDNGFGLQANYTYTDTNDDVVVGISENMANLMGYFENDTFGARLMYNYRSEWSKGFHWNGNPLSNDAYGQWDASFSYNITDNAQLTFEAVNLTDEQIIEYSEDEDRLMSLYENGRRFAIGARYTF
ncbi:TonB-dependent receptor [Microbulbifer thermotolerans]|uniref:TonB-dependent receptor n=1 Tax=Microbulbifer thermotolerans TaxID=252514 RepID=UPI002248ED71|nr:TonB-dependent receptor [Microbulbifer thermotolerans]MCX2830015.1 TonB-dependent receptor [Microbulbifer thermotolerans]